MVEWHLARINCAKLLLIGGANSVNICVQHWWETSNLLPFFKKKNYCSIAQNLLGHAFSWWQPELHSGTSSPPEKLTRQSTASHFVEQNVYKSRCHCELWPCAEIIFIQERCEGLIHYRRKKGPRGEAITNTAALSLTFDVCSRNPRCSEPGCPWSEQRNPRRGTDILIPEPERLVFGQTHVASSRS